MRMLVTSAVIGAAMVVAHGAPAQAQAPSGADTLSARAVAESLSVLRTLDEAVRADRRDAAAWHRRGMVAWTLSIRARATPTLRELDASRLSRTTDESLRQAVEIDSDNARYRLSLGQYLLTSTSTITRASASRHIERAIELARAGNDRMVHADAAIEAARVQWRRYESQAHRRLVVDTGLARSIEEAAVRNPLIAMGGGDTRLPTENAINRIHSLLLEATQPLPADVGMADYRAAEELFREAYEAAPQYSRAFRQYAMLLAEKERWSELSVLARNRTAQAPNDAWAWLTLGLALHRGREPGPAKNAFDTALERMDDRERRRLTGLHRLLRPADTAAYLRAPDDVRRSSDQTFWMMADQLWSRPGNDPLSEFLARVTYSELRWTIDELGIRGADSDRGDIFIRYGPPDVIAKVGPRNREDDITNMSWETQRPITNLASETVEVTFWDWNTGMLVVFWSTPGFGTARLAEDDRQHVDYLVDQTPSTWNNVAEERIIPMPAYIARFRAPGDSIDVLIATQAPVAEIRAASAVNVPIRADLWMFGRDVPDVVRDSLELRTGSMARWIYRVPQSAYLYRIEATADGALVAGSVSAWLTARADTATGFTTRGFGVSDLLLGTRAGEAPDARRWDEIEITPMLGPLPRSSTLTVLWENYDFGARSQMAQYDVSLTLQRDRSTTGRIVAEIVGALAAIASIDRRDDRITVTFDRTVPHTPAFVDRVDLALGATPPGQYRLEVRVTDRVSGRSVVRHSVITIAN